MRPVIQDEYGILKLQNIILNIMKYIHELCEKHGIDYYIIGGTALGAVRHGGFIPWDDDLDIAMTRDNYNKFLEVCKKELDRNEFFLQEGRKDWYLYFSKLRLKNTVFNEEHQASYDIPIENRGIFVDVFPLDKAANSKLGRLWQYGCSKMLIAYAMRGIRYENDTWSKKVAKSFATILKIRRLRVWMMAQVTKYNQRSTKYIGDFFDKVSFKDASYPRELWGKPTLVAFEGIELYAPEKLHDYLSFYFGDYMKLPPIEKRVCGHNNGVEFGKYIEYESKDKESSNESELCM